MNAERELFLKLLQRGLEHRFNMCLDDCGNRFCEMEITEADNKARFCYYRSDRSAQLTTEELRAQVVRRALRDIEQNEE